MAVDHDISNTIAKLHKSPNELIKINQAVQSIKDCIMNGNKIYIYGAGSTGRLAVQIQKIWYNYWHSIKSLHNYNNLLQKLNLPYTAHNKIENAIIGEITGGDRALIKSLEGLEDLFIIGKLQLIDHNITANDVVFAVTEGGETSAVIGTIEAAADLPRSNKKNLYFIYNNPDSLLMPLTRSNNVITDNRITKYLCESYCIFCPHIF